MTGFGLPEIGVIVVVMLPVTAVALIFQRLGRISRQLDKPGTRVPDSPSNPDVRRDDA
ncbi:MAG: hypothetical protein WBA63_05145 [Thermomicrobiales bacterium]